MFNMSFHRNDDKPFDTIQTVRKVRNERLCQVHYYSESVYAKQGARHSDCIER